MAPNLLVAVQTIVSPTRWFSKKKDLYHDCGSDVEQRDTPVPGTYRRYPGRGWYLVALDTAADSNAEETKRYESLINKEKVVLSRVLNRWLFQSEFNERRRAGYLPQTSSPSSAASSTTSFHSSVHSSVRSQRQYQKTEVGFFRLDDGTTWVNNTDAQGRFIKGPYTLYVVASESEHQTCFKELLKNEDRKASVTSSVANSTAPSTAPSTITSVVPSRCVTRRNSYTSRMELERRPSQMSDMGVVMEQVSTALSKTDLAPPRIITREIHTN